MLAIGFLARPIDGGAGIQLICISVSSIISRDTDIDENVLENLVDGSVKRMLKMYETRK